MPLLALAQGLIFQSLCFIESQGRSPNFCAAGSKYKTPASRRFGFSALRRRALICMPALELRFIAFCTGSEEGIVARRIRTPEVVGVGSQQVIVGAAMSQMGQQRTCRPRNPTSVLPPRPDIVDQAGHVGLVPTTEVPSFDDLVGADEERGRDRQPN